jgi:Uma2 family endonuclease
MPMPKEYFYTVDDIYALPEGSRAELIDGEMYLMAPPTRGHQRIAGALYRKIADHIDSKGGDCEVDIAPFAVFLNADDQNYVEPDISVICDRSKLTEKGCNGAPDWIIEIVSPSSRRTDYFTKLFKYRTAGVREYWIVDPEKASVRVYNFESEDTGDYSFSDSIPVGIYEGFSIDFSQLNI